VGEMPIETSAVEGAHAARTPRCAAVRAGHRSGTAMLRPTAGAGCRPRRTPPYGRRRQFAALAAGVVQPTAPTASTVQSPLARRMHGYGTYTVDGVSPGPPPSRRRKNS
jgi:hypothetical protein